MSSSRYAKNNPGKLSFGVQGLVGEMQMSLEQFKKTAGINVTQVPYNSGAQAIVDLLADRLDAMFLVVPPIKQHVEDGKLIALATLNATRVRGGAEHPDHGGAGPPGDDQRDLVRLSRARQDAGRDHRQARAGVSGAEIRSGAQTARHRDGRGAQPRRPCGIRQADRRRIAAATARSWPRAISPHRTEIRTAGWQIRAQSAHIPAAMQSELRASIISIKNLSKTYASGFQALKSIDLDIRRGEIFALLGPERRRQDHADQHRLRHRQCDRRHGDGRRPRHRPRLPRGARA